MPTSEVERLLAWSQLRHRIIALQLEADLPKQVNGSKEALTYIPVFLGGLGAPDSFWPDRRRAVALREEGLSPDEFILQESARWAHSPTRQEREAQQEREIPFLRKLIDLTYEAYRTDWVEQGMKISPAFLWAVRQKVFAAVTLYLMEDEKLTRELLNTSCLHLPVGFAPARLAGLLRRLPMSFMSRRRFQAIDYINNLVDRIRVEALKLESVEPSLKKEGTAVEQEQAREVSLRQSVAGNQNRRGRKRDDKITDRNKEIATLLASGKPLLEVAKILDAQRKYSVPKSWMIVEDDGTTYPVKNFEKAYYDPELRKKLKGLAYDVGRSHGKIVGLSD